MGAAVAPEAKARPASKVVPSKPRLHTCPACKRTRVTLVRRGVCAGCYERLFNPRERHTLATCVDCGRTRWAYYRRRLCPACYEQRRRRRFTCLGCERELEAPASFAAMRLCPRCYTARKTTVFACPACGVTAVTRPQHGVCRRCYEQRRVHVATCRVCGQTRKTEFTGGVCRACRSQEESRREGVRPAAPAAPPEVLEARLLAQLAPLRRAWVREFLATGYRRMQTKTRTRFLHVLGRFDGYLSDETPVGGGQWSLVTVDHVHVYLASCGRLRLQETVTFFRWVRTRRDGPALANAIARRNHAKRIRVLPVETVLAWYQRWTASAAAPTAGNPEPSPDVRPPRETPAQEGHRLAQALAGLLVLVHCFSAGELRTLRVADVLAPDRVRTGNGRGGKRALQLAPPAAAALERYLAWRAVAYGGPSTYLFVTRASRLHDRPPAASWFHENLLGETPPASLRQSAIQQLVQALGCDGLELAACTRRGLQTVQDYLKIFGHPAPPPTPPPTRPPLNG